MATRKPIAALIALLFVAAWCVDWARAAGDDTTSDAPVPPRYKAGNGALDNQMRHRLRVLVPYDQTLFFVDHDKQYGILAALGRTLQTWINRTHQAHVKQVTVDLVPVARDRLLQALADGQGDVAAADLAVGGDRLVPVDFTDPWISDVADVVVTGPTAPSLKSDDDLAGAEIYVRRSSRYAAQLALLNESLTGKGLAPITLAPADESLEDEDLMEMVNAGLLPMTVVDRRKAMLWAQVLPNLTVHADLQVGHGGDVAWAVRKDSPELLATLNAFLQSHGRAGMGFGGAPLKKAYYANLQFAENAYAPDAVTRFDQAFDLFQRAGEQYGLDPLLLAGLAYQESGLDQSRHGGGGALGIMQVLPATAADPSVGIDHIDADTAANIEAGAKYLRTLIDDHFADAAIDPKNRMLMAIAAYKVGPDTLERFRQAATQAGLDPDVWFDNVENGAARAVGRQVVQYVRNVYQYSVAYGLLLAKEKRGN
jgi:membrane-bound lytic murein transglycosylase MltF